MPADRLIREVVLDVGEHLLGEGDLVRRQHLRLFRRGVIGDRLTVFRLRRLCQRGGRGTDYEREGRTESEQATWSHYLPILPVSCAVFPPKSSDRSSIQRFRRRR